MSERRRRSSSVGNLVAAVLMFACLSPVLAPMVAADVTVASLVIGSFLDPLHPEVGDVVSIAFDVSALGIAGLPAYQLRGAEELFAGEFNPEPRSASFPDRVVFDLTALRPGVAEIQLYVDYEAEHCDGEHCYYAFRGQLSSVVRIEVGTGEPHDDLPDLVATRVDRLSEFPACPPEGIFFCVENRGAAPATGFQILLHVVDGGSTVRFLTELPVGQEICLGVPVPEEGELISNEPGARLEVFVDAMHEVAEGDEGNNRSVFDIPVQPVPPGGCPTPTPTPSAGLRIDGGLTLPCNGSFEVSVSTTAAPGESVTIEAISFHHGYSQGDYGTGFNWDLSEIALPMVLASGEHLTIPVTYGAGGAFNSRLHLEVTGTARNGSGVFARTIYFGRLCGTPGPTWTPTPTPTPLPTGDLGEVEVRGVVYDALRGRDSHVSSALLTFRVALRAPSYGQAFTDSEGRFVFPLRLLDTDRFEIRVDAPSYFTQSITYPALDALGSLEIPLYPVPPGGPLQDIDSPLCAADCNGDLQVDIEELIKGVAIALGKSSLEGCAAADTSEDGRVSISEVVAGIDNALAGCRPIGNPAIGRLDQAWVGPRFDGCGLDDRGYGLTGLGPLAQEFTPTTAELSGVAVVLSASTVRRVPIDVHIREGSMDGPEIGTASTEVAVSAADWVVFEFDPPLGVTPGRTYVIGMTSQSPYFYWQGVRGVGAQCELDQYRGGDAFVDGGRDPETDFLFATFGADEFGNQGGNGP